MKKNRIKDILDLLNILLVIATIILIKYTDILFLIPLVLWVILLIIERIFWRCKKCGNYLPVKTFFNQVICCPYCKNEIE